jgi:cytochrome c-type biogenesis protein CcmE
MTTSDEPKTPAPTVTAAPVAPPRQRRPGYARYAIVLTIGVVIAMVASTFRGSAMVYSKYVDEIARPAERARWVGRTLRVEGLVAPASIEHRPGTRDFRFRVARNHAELQVTYSGIVPDTFRDCAGVTVRGVLGNDGVFRSDEIVAKCPSKYEAATVVNGECIVGMAPEAPGRRM